MKKIIVSLVVICAALGALAGDWVFNLSEGVVTDGEFVYNASAVKGGVAVGTLKSSPSDAYKLDFTKSVVDSEGKKLKFVAWDRAFAKGLRRLQEVHFKPSALAGIQTPYLDEAAKWLRIATVVHTDDDIDGWKRLPLGHPVERCCFLRRLETVPKFPENPMQRIVAHMGGSEFARSNSFAAYKAAVENGVISLECDTQIAPEGYLYLSHDPQKEPEKFTKLKEILPFVQKGIDLQLDCKCREAGEDEQIRILKEDGAHQRGRIIFATWDTKFAHRIHRELPEAVVWTPVMIGKKANLAEPRNTPVGIAMAAWFFPAEGIALQWNPELCTTEFFEELARLGVEVDVWTIDDPETFQLALKRGARWVTTNNPVKMSK